MTTSEEIQARLLRVAAIRVVADELEDRTMNSEIEVPDALRSATAADIKPGAVIWYPGGAAAFPNERFFTIVLLQGNIPSEAEADYFTGSGEYQCSLEGAFVEVPHPSTTVYPVVDYVFTTQEETPMPDYMPYEYSRRSSR